MTEAPRIKDITLKDRYSGSRVFLRLRGGKVVGATGCEPARFLGLTEAEARHRARYAQVSGVTPEQLALARA